MDDEASVTIKVTDTTAEDAATTDAAFRARARTTPDSVAFTDSPDRRERSLGEARTISYGQASAIADRVKQELLQLGLEQGDIIAIQAPNIVEVPLILLGAWRAGLIPSLMPVMWQLDEIHHAFAITKPKAAVTIAQYGSEQPAVTLGEVAAKHMSIRFLLSLGENPPDGFAPIKGWFETPENITPEPEDVEASEQPETSLALLTWMAGRKGIQPVARSHAELVETGRMFVREFDLKPSDIMLNPYPYSSIAALAGQLIAPVLSGAQTVLHLPFDFPTYINQLEQNRITCAIAPAPVISALEERRDLHSTRFKLRKLGCVWPSPHTVKASPALFEPSLPTIDVHSFVEFAVFPRIRAPGSNPSLLPLGKIRKDNEDNEGNILLETRIRGSVKTENEKQILRGTLTVRGATVPSGLFSIDDGAAGPATGAYHADASGFVDTGIGAIAGDDIAGHFRCEKSEDIIYHGGASMPASELDLLYSAFDEFLDAAAFVLEDGAVGERIFAAVVPQPDLSPSLDRFKSYLEQKRVASYKVPDQLIIVRSIPRNSDGAVLRDQILAQI